MLHRQITLDIDSIQDKALIDHLVHERCSAAMLTPDLVEEKAILKPEVYNRLKDLDAKNAFRANLLKRLGDALERHLEQSDSAHLITTFIHLTNQIDNHGALILGNMIDVKSFEQLIDSYTSKLSTDGSKSWIHSYINLGNHPDFITNPAFNAAFIHPLLVALIAYAAGGPIRLVDGRGKDAEPLAVQAQDNMLHIDNTPFRKEYKIILTWERGKASGPKGQNFVFLPGTHKAVRNCKIDDHGEAWSTEDGSIFITDDIIQQAFDVQKKVLGQSPVVVEVTHPDMPLTTVFEAGALVHHRYRTKEKNVPRSCVIFAFHRAEDNPGQFLDQAHIEKLVGDNKLLMLMMGKHSDNTEAPFIDALLNNTASIVDKLRDIDHPETGAKLVTFKERILDANELEKWKAAVTAAPTVEDIKIKQGIFQVGAPLTPKLLLDMMRHDKHGPLDLILYSDGHEEIRKWARNRIREMPLPKLKACIDRIMRSASLARPHQDHLLTPTEIHSLARQLLVLIDQLPLATKERLIQGTQEKISPVDACRSLRQLINDLGEAVVRCSSRQAFLSTCLFLFFACDELSHLVEDPTTDSNPRYHTLRNKLLQHYLATSILVSKHIAVNQPSKKPILNVSSELSLFRGMVKATRIHERHQSDESQHEYDKPFGLSNTN